MPICHYHLGCPIWAKKEWVGELFAARTRSTEFLSQYASVFNAVEGNTTFYALPSPASVSKWKEQTPDGFQFCFKFHRAISHEKGLLSATGETHRFLETLSPLGNRLGPFFVQLPGAFGPERLDVLEAFLTELPPDFQYAVEVRHPEFFAPGSGEADLNLLLSKLRIDRVVFDTRGLHAAEPNRPFIREAQRRKPKVPARFVATADRPFVRFVGHPNVEENSPLLGEWAAVIAEWINAGKHPYVFMHAPDDFYAPRLARHFHRLLYEHLASVGDLPVWPAETEPSPPEQLSLL